MGCHFLLQGLGWSPIDLYSKEFPGDANVADPGAHFETHWNGACDVCQVRGKRCVTEMRQEKRAEKSGNKTLLSVSC